MMDVKKKSQLSILVILLVMAAIVFGLGTIFFRYNVKKSTDTWSSSLPSAAERMAFYEEYVLCPTAVEDIAFHIAYDDHSKDIFPSASNYEIASILRIEPALLEEWLGGFVAAEEEEIQKSWWAELETDGFQTVSEPAYYKTETGNAYQAVYFEEGILKQYFFQDITGRLP